MVVDTSDLTDDAAGTGSGKAASIRCATELILDLVGVECVRLSDEIVGAL